MTLGAFKQGVSALDWAHAYESFARNYNVPELLAKRIEAGPKDFARAALSGEPPLTAHAVTGATPKAYDGTQ